jgi:hypothetical protein
MLAPAPGPPARAAAVEVVLVGWHLAVPVAGPAALARVQHRTAPDRPAPADAGALVRLVSVDYGKTMGRWWVGAAGRRRWLAALGTAKAGDPGRLLRVYNLPVDDALFRTLRAAGVDLIGTKRIVAARAPLAALARTLPPRRPGGAARTR